jgi:hypothetical protein
MRRSPDRDVRTPIGRISLLQGRCPSLTALPAAGMPPTTSMRSRIVELDAATGAISIRFQGAGKAAFFTAILGKQQLLDNGNLLVTAAH